MKRRIGYDLACLVALSLVFLLGVLLNRYFIPMLGQISPLSRVTSAASEAVVLIVLSLVVMWYPRRFDALKVLIGTGVLFVLGIPVLLIGITSRIVWMLYVGGALVSAAKGMLTVVVGIACIDLSSRSLGLVVSGAFCLSVIVQDALTSLSQTTGMYLLIPVAFLSILLAAPHAYPLLERAFSSEAPAQRLITSPSTFLPLGHRLYLSFLLFSIVYGYAVALGEVDATPMQTYYTGFLLMLLPVYLLIRRKPLDPDRLFVVAALLVIAGFLVIPIRSLSQGALANGLLYVGSGFFKILVFYVLISLGRQNLENSVVALSWGAAMNAIGIIIGAWIGRLANALPGGGEMGDVVAAALLLVFIAYILVSFNGSRFQEAIRAVDRTEEIAEDSVPGNDLGAVCGEIGDTYSLTQREGEVLLLLAHGRTATFIQDRLVISYNTAKAHVRHIYSKLDVHSQQELIDLVEGWSQRAPR